ncbi:site-specific DNA-methyltransferase [Microcella sp.]|uniref:site-specific DNA-methyltransferase n=1 Tax=Microcella sp. TaxID=1913979 RepID=UPI003F711CF0
MTGRLTLNWANKDRALLSHGESGYEWVDRDDPRAREVRLLDEVGRVGEVDGDASDNLLIRGDSLDALRALVHTPELAAEYRGRVKLVYIDPPFNTGQAFEHYDDSLEHSVWLGMMRERLVLIKDLLSPEGSVWVHLDDAEMAYCKVLMDEIFGRQSFVASFVWQKADSPSSNNVPLATYHDFILVYGTGERTFRASAMEDPAVLDAFPGLTDEGVRFRDRLLRKNGKASLRTERPSMWFPIPSPDGELILPIDDDGVERRWAYSEDSVASMLASNDIIWKRRPKRDGGEQWVPYTREFAPEIPTRPWPTLWSDVLMNRQAKAQIKKIVQGVATFDTPKPEQLLERVIKIATAPGDVVLDCFAGSGTTAAVAHKMSRRWVTVELSENTADTFTKPRLEKVVAGEDPGGITESAGWTGGGGFRDLRIASSCWQVLDSDAGLEVYRAEGIDTATLRRAVAAQLGYALIEHPVFAGVRGRSRLAVVDGVVDATAVADIAAALAEGETALVAGASVTDDAQSTLRDLNKGSRVLRIPRDLFPRTGAVTR